MRLLQHSVETTTKHGMIEDVWDYYDTWSELLLSAMTGGQGYYGTRPRIFVGLWWFDSWSTKSLAQNGLG